MDTSNKNKIILDLCAGTGAWSKPYKDAGYDVRVLTLPDYDVRNWKNTWLGKYEASVYGILAAPPCTAFSKAAWKIKRADRKFKEGMEIVKACMNIIWATQEKGAPLAFWALENPMGYLYRFLGYPVHFFQPWQYGETNFTKTKRTAIWGYFNPPIKTVSKRTFPFVSPHTSKRDAVNEERENKLWYRASAAKRAQTSEHFAEAFFKANQ